MILVAALAPNRLDLSGFLSLNLVSFFKEP